MGIDDTNLTKKADDGQPAEPGSPETGPENSCQLTLLEHHSGAVAHDLTWLMSAPAIRVRRLSP